MTYDRKPEKILKIKNGKELQILRFLKNQLFKFLIIYLVMFNLQEHIIHQNKAEDILSRPNFFTFIATINIY